MQPKTDQMPELERLVSIFTEFSYNSTEEENALKLLNEISCTKDKPGSFSQNLIKAKTALNHLKLASLKDDHHNNEHFKQRLLLTAQAYELMGDYTNAYSSYSLLNASDQNNVSALGFFDEFSWRINGIFDAFSEEAIDVEKLHPYVNGVYNLVEPLTGVTIHPYRNYKPNVRRITANEKTICAKNLTAADANDQVLGFEKRKEAAPSVLGMCSSANKAELYVEDIEGIELTERIKALNAKGDFEAKRDLIIDLIVLLTDYQTIDLNVNTSVSDAQRYPSLIMESIRPLLKTYGVEDTFDKFSEGLNYLIAQQIPFAAGTDFYEQLTLTILSPWVAYGDFYLDNLIVNDGGIISTDGGKTCRVTSGFEDLSHIIDHPELEIEGIEKGTYALLYTTIKKFKILACTLSSEGKKLEDAGERDDAIKYYAASKQYADNIPIIIDIFRTGKFRMDSRGLADSLFPALSGNMAITDYVDLRSFLTSNQVFGQLETEAIEQIRKVTSIYRGIRTYAHVMKDEFANELIEYQTDILSAIGFLDNKIRAEILDGKKEFFGQNNDEYLADQNTRFIYQSTIRRIDDRKKQLQALDKEMHAYLDSAEQTLLEGVMDRWSSDFSDGGMWTDPGAELYKERDCAGTEEYLTKVQNFVAEHQNCTSTVIYGWGLMTYRLIKSLKDNHAIFLNSQLADALPLGNAY